MPDNLSDPSLSPTVQIQKTYDGSDTLYSTTYQQIFHSKFGAWTETHHVFLRGAGVEARLLKREATQVLEVGFGTGLNFFATADLAWRTQTPLHYVALEKDLLESAVLRALNHLDLLAAKHLYQNFLRWRDALDEIAPPAQLDLSLTDAIRLQILIGEATQAEIPPLNYHAIYQDAFYPDINPELWTAAFFAKLHALLSPRGQLATYSVKGTVRRALQAAGFEVEKRPGPPGKREMLVARRVKSLS